MTSPTPDPATADDEVTEAVRQALLDINAAWAAWTSGHLTTDDAMTAIRDHLTIAREHGALQ